jgi:hypothetical protein
MKCLICKDDPNAQRIIKDWNKEMDEKKLADHMRSEHFVQDGAAAYLAKLQHKIEFSHGP